MSVAPSAVHTTQLPSETAHDLPQKATTPPPAPFSPATWKYLYYACMAASIVVGLGTLLNGGAWQDAILRIFITLLGGSILAILFLTFVIVPLHVARYKDLVEAQQRALQAARDKAARKEKAKTGENGQETARGERGAPALAAEQAQAESLAEGQTGKVPARMVDDQASSLRRMVAEPRV